MVRIVSCAILLCALALCLFGQVIRSNTNTVVHSMSLLAANFELAFDVSARPDWTGRLPTQVQLVHLQERRLGLPNQKGIEVMPHGERGFGVRVFTDCELEVESIWRRLVSHGRIGIVAAASLSIDDAIIEHASKSKARDYSEGGELRASWCEVRSSDVQLVRLQREIAIRTDELGRTYLLLLSTISYTDAIGIADIDYQPREGERPTLDVTMNSGGQERFDRIRRSVAIDEPTPRLVCLVIDGIVVGYLKGALIETRFVEFETSMSAEECDDLRAITLSPPWGCPLEFVGCWGIDLRTSRDGFGTFWK